jgi:hypothetical protein
MSETTALRFPLCGGFLDISFFAIPICVLQIFVFLCIFSRKFICLYGIGKFHLYLH